MFLSAVTTRSRAATVFTRSASSTRTQQPGSKPLALMVSTSATRAPWSSAMSSVRRGCEGEDAPTSAIPSLGHVTRVR